jgi:hypothetical protein
MRADVSSVSAIVASVNTHQPMDVQRWSRVGAEMVVAEGGFVEADGVAWFSSTIRES